MLGINFSKREFLFPVFLSFLTVLISTLPVIYGFSRSNRDYRFTGFLSHYSDANTYLSWMKQAKDGNILFEEKFSTESQPRNIFILYFLFGGYASRIFGIPLPITYQIMRVISGFILLISAYLFISYFLEKRLWRRLAFVLVCFSAGFGGYFASLYQFLGFSLPARWIPSDQNTPELVTFWTITWFGHGSLAVAFILLIFLFLLYSIKNGKIFALFSGLLLGILALFHPYDIVTISLVISLYIFLLLIFRKKEAKEAILRVLLMFLVAFPAMAFQYYTLQTNPIVKAWSRYVFYPFGNFIAYIFGFGFIFFLAILGAWQIIKRREDKLYFLLLWVVAISIAIYFPFIPFQRHISYGVHIPFCILATIGLVKIFNKFGCFTGDFLKRRGVALFSLLLLLVSPTNLMHLIVDFRNGHRRLFPYFLSQDLVEAFNWLDKNTSPNEIILGARNICSFIPPNTGSKVYIGHWAETINIHYKEEIFKKFMQSSTDDEFRIKFLKDEKISYLIQLEEESRSLNLEGKVYLQRVFANPSAKIYKVNLNE